MAEPTPLAYRPRDAAAVLGVGRAKFYELLKTGEIRARKLGTATLVERIELERYLAGLPYGSEVADDA